MPPAWPRARSRTSCGSAFQQAGTLYFAPPGYHLLLEADRSLRLGMGWTIVDFLSAANLDPNAMAAVELPDLPAMSLYAYYASAWPPGQVASRMMEMLPPLLD